MGIKGDGNRQRIIASASNLFYRRGYNQTSFQDISDATSIPRGNFYYYFKTKDEILNAVIDARVEGLSAMLKRCETETDDAKERLLLFSDMLERNRDDVIETGCPMGSLCSELVKDTPVLHDKAKQAFVLLRHWIKRQFDSLMIADADQLAMDLLAKIQGATVMACVFNDADYVDRSHMEIKRWINEKTMHQ